MKKSLFLLLTLAAALVSMTVIAPANYKVDVQNSQLEWIGRKVTGSHTGTIALQEGNLVFEGDVLTGGNFSIDMSSIACTDITDAETSAKLVGHLKSDDFFGVATHPKASFTITKVESKTKNNYEVTGDLTIKGITNQVSFPATVSVKGGTVKAEANITVDRSRFDVRFGSDSFFDNLGDKVIYDDFELALSLTARGV